MRAPGDRRDRIRFEVFGPFWGTLDVGEPARVLDLSSHGALIETAQPLAIESIQSVSLVIDGDATICDARVRHVTPGEDGDGYLVGLEFIAAPTAFLEAVDRLVAFRASHTEHA
jgi:hypothetical protein